MGVISNPHPGAAAGIGEDPISRAIRIIGVR